MINNLQDAVQELYFYQRGTAGGFQTMLFDLFQKADHENKAKLASAFPLQAKALEMWNNATENGEALFKEFGLEK